MRIKIDFCDFWPGFSKTDNFFVHLLRKRFEVEICDSPDFLFYCDPGQHVHRLHHCVKIYFGVENWMPDWSECDYALTCHYLDDPRHFRLPYYVVSCNPSKLIKTNEDESAIVASKTKFCAFVVGNAHPKKTRQRIEFFHRLTARQKVDSAGSAMNNMGFVLPYGPGPKQEFLRPYKFNIAFENSSVPGYTTEKLIDAMLARCVPIYWGDPRVSEEFNPKSFLNLADFPSQDALIDKILELDRDEARYLEYLREPYFHGNKPNACFDYERILDFFQRILTTRIRPVSSSRRGLQIGRWIPVKKNRGPEFRP